MNTLTSARKQRTRSNTIILTLAEKRRPGPALRYSMLSKSTLFARLRWGSLPCEHYPNVKPPPRASFARHGLRNSQIVAHHCPASTAQPIALRSFPCAPSPPTHAQRVPPSLLPSLRPGPGARSRIWSTQLLGPFSPCGARPRVPPGDDDVSPATVPVLGAGCYNHRRSLRLGLGLACQRTQYLLQGRRGRCLVEGLAEGRSWGEDAVERGRSWACDVLENAKHR